MSHLVDFFNSKFGAGSTLIIALIFLSMAIAGIVIAFRGRQIMVWLVGFCAVCVGIISGGMVGLLVFNSFIIMLIAAFLGGVAFLILVKYVRAVGYFIGISVLGFVLSYLITSEMYITNPKITESTLLLLDLLVGLVMGILSVVKSKYIVSIVTAATGGTISAISIMVLFGYYFSNWKMWILAAAFTVCGLLVQIKIYDLKPDKKIKNEKQRKKRYKH